MQRQSYPVKTVLEQKGARKKTFLAFKDSLGNPLSRSPRDICPPCTSPWIGISMFKVVSSTESSMFLAFTFNKHSRGHRFVLELSWYPNCRYKTILLLVTVGLALHGAGYCHGSLTEGARMRTAGPSSLHSLQPTNRVFDCPKWSHFDKNAIWQNQVKYNLTKPN